MSIEHAIVQVNEQKGRRQVACCCGWHSRWQGTESMVINLASAINAWQSHKGRPRD